MSNWHLQLIMSKLLIYTPNLDPLMLTTTQFFQLLQLKLLESSLAPFCLYSTSALSANPIDTTHFLPPSASSIIIKNSKPHITTEIQKEPQMLSRMPRNIDNPKKVPQLCQTLRASSFPTYTDTSALPSH